MVINLLIIISKVIETSSYSSYDAGTSLLLVDYPVLLSFIFSRCRLWLLDVYACLLWLLFAVWFAELIFLVVVVFFFPFKWQNAVSFCLATIGSGFMPFFSGGKGVDVIALSIWCYLERKLLKVWPVEAILHYPFSTFPCKPTVLDIEQQQTWVS